MNSKVRPKRLKSMDMRFYWLRDRETLKQFRIYWRSGKLNLADYFTKHHAAAHHRNTRGEYLTPKEELQRLRAETRRLEKIENTTALQRKQLDQEVDEEYANWLTFRVNQEVDQ